MKMTNTLTSSESNETIKENVGQVAVSPEILEGDNCTQSPFQYHNGMKLICLNMKNTCTFDEIKTFALNGALNTLDFDLMRTLYVYEYLNRNSLEYYCNSISPKHIRSLKKRLNRLVKMGILLRFTFVWNEQGILSENMIENYANQSQEEPSKENNPEENQLNVTGIRRTTCIYALSKGAYTLIKQQNPFSILLKNSEKTFDFPTEATVLNRLVYNQFALRFNNQLKQYIKAQSYYKSCKIKGYRFTIEGLFHLQLPEIGKICLAAVPIRRTPEWHTELLLKMQLIYTYFERSPHIKPFLLIICEDDAHIREAFLTKEMHNLTKGIYTLFTTDISIMSSKIAKELYLCELDERMDYKVACNGNEQDDDSLSSFAVSEENILQYQHLMQCVVMNHVKLLP